MARLSPDDTRRGGESADPGDTRRDQDGGDDGQPDDTPITTPTHENPFQHSSGDSDLEMSGDPGQASLGSRLRTERSRRGISQVRLAALAGVSNSYISYVESGQRNPSPDVIVALAGHLACDPHYLVCGASPESVDGLRTAVRYAQIALEHGDTREARNQFTRALASPALASLPGLAATAREGAALAAEAEGDLEAAIALLTGLIADADPAAAPDDHARISMALVRCHRNAGDLDTATATGEHAMARLVPYGWSDAIVKLGATVLNAHRARGDLTYANHLANHLIGHAEILGSHTARMSILWNSALLAEERGDPAEALRLADRALALLSETTDDERNLRRLHGVRAGFLLIAHPERAAEARDQLAKAARGMATSAASDADQAWCLTDLADAELLLGHPAAALTAATHALDLLNGTPMPETANALTALAHAHLRLGHQPEAITALAAAQAALPRAGLDRHAAKSWVRLADAYAAAGLAADQATALQHAMDRAGL